MLSPAEVIEKWCAIADSKMLTEHRRAFWVLRDIIEGREPPSAMVSQAIQFFKLHCKESEEKQTLATEFIKRGLICIK